MDKPVFDPEFYRELASENPFGLTLHWREVEAWFDYIAWPAYKTYNYKLHRKATRRWWAKASQRDLDRAREARENHLLENASQQHPVTDRMTASEIVDNPPNNDIVHKILGGSGGTAE